MFAGVGFVHLPTYAFERRRFWLPVKALWGCRSLGLGATEHSLLGAVVELPDSGGVVLTGRLSAASHPWLADHAVAGVMVFPGRDLSSWRSALATRSAVRQWTS